MPLWRILYPEGVYNAADKQALAAAITQIYTTTSPAQLPAFYVNVIFIELQSDNVYVGGEAHSRFVRFTGEHIARHMHAHETTRMHRFMDWFTAAVKPWTNDRGLRWEAHISQTPSELWRVDGLVPPPPNSRAEAMWRRLNDPVPYDVDDGVGLDDENDAQQQQQQQQRSTADTSFKPSTNTSAKSILGNVTGTSGAMAASA